MNSIHLNDTVRNEIAKVTETASYLWNREWAERNGGNISLNLTEIIGDLPDNYDGFRYVECSNFPKMAGGLVLFVTGTGERLRELVRPEDAACILRFNDECSGYHLLWGGRNLPGYRPTSEFISHVKIHLDKLSNCSEHRAVLHTHPSELICLSHHPVLCKDENAFNTICWGMLPEVRLFVPKGIGIVDYVLIGSEALADRTIFSLRSRDVVLWRKHGALATGKDALAAFDFIDVANKGAKLYLACLASGFVPEGLSLDEMQELATVFKL